MTDTEPTAAITARIRMSPQRWKVTLAVASSAGIRESHATAEVNAPDQFVAAVTAMAVEFDHIRPPGRWSEIHLMVEPILPRDTDKPLLTEEQIIARAERKNG